MRADKIMDHANYPKSLKKKTIAELMFTMKDAQEAIDANPTNPNNGYYADEVCYCGDEIRRRQK